MSHSIARNTHYYVSVFTDSFAFYFENEEKNAKYLKQVTAQ